MENLGNCPDQPTRANNSKRITVLSEAEKNALYGLPDFDDFQRAEYFALTEAEHTLVFRRKDILAQLYCLLQIAYFKAKQALFRFSLEEDPLRSSTSFRHLRTVPQITASKRCGVLFGWFLRPSSVLGSRLRLIEQRKNWRPRSTSSCRTRASCCCIRSGI